MNKKWLKVTSYLFTIIGVFFLNIPFAFAKENIEIKSITISDKSETITLDELSYENNNITSQIVFNQLNDFVTLNIEVSNNSNINYVFEAINNSISNEHLLIESENIGETIKKGNTNIIKVKIKYNKERVNQDDLVLNNVSLKLLFRDPNQLVNPLTSKNLLIILIFIIPIVILTILSYKIKKSQLLLLVLFLFPVFVSAEEITNVEISFSNITVKARHLQYRVLIDNGTGEKQETTKTWGETIGELPEIVEKTGYNTIGWVNQKNEAVSSNTKITEELTITPKYDPIVYNITYNLNKGSLKKENKKTYTVEDEFTLNNPTRQGYTFVGWSEGSTGIIQTNVTIYKGTTGDKSYTAFYSQNEDTKYTVIHRQMNMNGIYEETEREELEGVTDTNITPQPKHYPGFITPQEQTKLIQPDGSTEFVYDYEREKYQFSITDRTYLDSTSTIDGEYYYGTTITLKAQTRLGYTFSWSDGSTDLNRTFELTEPKNISLVYTPNTNTAYRVVHKKMNLDETYSIADDDTFYGTTDTNVTPNTNNYTGFKQPEKQTVKIKGDGTTLVIYLYEREKYQLTLENEDYIETTTPTGKYYYETSITLKAKDKNNQPFIKWSNNNTNRQITFNLLSDTTIGPIFEEDEYIISFDSGGAGDVDPIHVIPDSPIGTLPVVSKNNYVFDGWYTDLNNGIKVDNTYIPSGSITLYAKWISLNSDYISITYNANGGTFTGGDSTNNVIITKTAKISYTSNVDSTGKKVSNYADDLTNTAIRGTGRTSGSSSAHVITINNASKLRIDIFYNGENTKYDWVSIWQGSHSGYNATDNYSSAISGASKLGGSQSGTYTVNGNTLYNMGHSTFIVNGDTVTFGFKSDYSECGNGYGYYAIVRGLYSNSSEYKEPTFGNKVFAGWDSDFSYYTTSTLSNRTINAQWYDKITFNANGGSVSPSSRNITPGSSIGTLPTPTRTLYRFDGWHTDQYNESRVDSSYVPNGPMTLYAHWIALPYYTISFDSNGGSSVSSIKIEQGTSIGSLSTPTRTGYYFDGWYTSNNSDGTKVTSSYVPTSDKTLYARWKKSVKSLNITNQTMNIGPGQVQTINITNSNEIEENYTFTSNNTSIATVDSNGKVTGKAIGSTTITITGSTSNQTVTITVNVTYNSYTITLDSNGGDINKEIQCVNIAPLDNLPTPKKDNYIFLGWYTNLENGIKIENDFYPTSDMTIYAKWSTQKEYTISFEANGGTEVADIVVPDNQAITELPISIRNQYHLDGWYTELNSGIKIDTPYYPTDSIKLYAKWSTAGTYTVTFDPNSGSVSETSRSVYADTPIGDLPTPTRTDYSFIGWLDENTNTYYSPTTIPTGNVTLKAQWNTTNYVARINDTYYTSISTAISNASTNDTIVLLKNTSETPTNNKKVTLDLNGYKLTGNITNNSTGDLTIINGTIEGSSSTTKLISNSGILTIGTNKYSLNDKVNLKLERSTDSTIYSIYGGKVVVNNASIIIKNSSSASVYGIYSNDITINDCEIDVKYTGANNSNCHPYGIGFTGSNPKLVMNGGKITSHSNAHWSMGITVNVSNANIVINDGEIYANTDSARYYPYGIEFASSNTFFEFKKGKIAIGQGRGFALYVEDDINYNTILMSGGTVSTTGIIGNDNTGRTIYISGSSANNHVILTGGKVINTYNGSSDTPKLIHTKGGKVYIYDGEYILEPLSTSTTTSVYPIYNYGGSIYYYGGTFKVKGTVSSFAYYSSSLYLPSGKQVVSSTDSDGYTVYSLGNS